MAKDRAKDPKRVPSLGISDPISHVVTLPQELTNAVVNHDGNDRQASVKKHNQGQTEDAAGIKSGWPAQGHAKHVEWLNEGSPKTTVKINTDPAKGK